MYWTNFRQPTAHVQQNIFEETLYKFVVYIFTLVLAPFTSKLFNYSCHSESLNIRNLDIQEKLKRLSSLFHPVAMAAAMVYVQSFQVLFLV